MIEKICEDPLLNQGQFDLFPPEKAPEETGYQLVRDFDIRGVYYIESDNKAMLARGLDADNKLTGRSWPGTYSAKNGRMRAKDVSGIVEHALQQNITELVPGMDFEVRYYSFIPGIYSDPKPSVKESLLNAFEVRGRILYNVIDEDILEIINEQA